MTNGKNTERITNEERMNSVELTNFYISGLRKVENQLLDDSKELDKLDIDKKQKEDLRAKYEDAKAVVESTVGDLKGYLEVSSGSLTGLPEKETLAKKRIRALRKYGEFKSTLDRMKLGKEVGRDTAPSAKIEAEESKGLEKADEVLKHAKNYPPGYMKRLLGNWLEIKQLAANNNVALGAFDNVRDIVKATQSMYMKIARDNSEKLVLGFDGLYGPNTARAHELVMGRKSELASRGKTKNKNVRQQLADIGFTDEQIDDFLSGEEPGSNKNATDEVEKINEIAGEASQKVNKSRRTGHIRKGAVLGVDEIGEEPEAVEETSDLEPGPIIGGLTGVKYENLEFDSSSFSKEEDGTYLLMLNKTRTRIFASEPWHREAIGPVVFKPVESEPGNYLVEVDGEEVGKKSLEELRDGEALLAEIYGRMEA